MSVDGSPTTFFFPPLRIPADALLREKDAVPSTSDGAAVPAAAGPCPVCPLLEEKLKATQQAAYWRAMHRRATEREAQLKQRGAQLQTKLRLREQQLFGRKTETSSSAQAQAAGARTTSGAARRPRGQQRGRGGHGRRDYRHLPAVVEEAKLTGADGCCPQCHLPFQPLGGTEDTTVLEIAVRAHRRVLRRHRYRPTCQCGVVPQVVTAPPLPRLIPKSLLGVSIWVTVLLDKYLFYRPTYRLLADLRSHALDLSLGTLTDGLRRLVPLVEPLYEALVQHSRQQTLWHADETRWLVFALIEGKVGYRWYLWVFHGRDVVVFVLAAGRAHDVPEEHLGPDAHGIMVVDRYKAYQVIEQVQKGLIVLAFCWAHVRRDFVEVARTWPEQAGWALAWLEGIGQLYALDDARLGGRHEPAALARADAAVRGAVLGLAVQGEAELADPQVHPARRKVLESLGDHWTGLTVFVEHPEVPMDNNTAERVQRGPVVGRKNYYGSGAVWAGRLAAMMFSLLQTLTLWQLNPRSYLTAYLTACAEAGGQAPEDVQRFWPWHLSAADRRRWSLAGAAENRDTS